MPNKNGIHHVVKEPDSKLWPKVTLCGKEVWYHDMPIGIEHAKARVEQGTYLQPCKKCMNKTPKEQE